MIRINVKMDIDAARRDLKDHQKEVNRAAARILERLAITVRKEADQEIRSRLSLKSSTVKGNILVKRPYGSQRLIRDIEAFGGPIPLKDYGARAVRRGVTFKIGRGKQRRLYMRQGRPGFINKNWGGGHVYVRTDADPPGPARAHITKVYGPGIAQAFVAKRTRERMERVAREKWPVLWQKEMAYRRGKLGV